MNDRAMVQSLCAGGKALEHATLEDYDRMKFTDYVIKETLRLYPPFPLLQREAQVDDVIGGLKIPQGTAVYVVPWMIHHSPTIWKNPDLFYPERWIINEYHADSPSDYAYIPFGRGPRMCAGSRLAMMELKILLLSICYNFDIIPHSPLVGIVPIWRVTYVFAQIRLTYSMFVFWAG